MGKLNKRGMLFTLALTFLVLTLFSLSIIIYNNSISSTKTTTDLLVFERVNDLTSSIEESVVKLFKNNINLEVNFTIYNHSYPETIISFSPLINISWSSLNTVLARLEDFVDLNVSIANMSHNFDSDPIDFYLRFSNHTKKISLDKSLFNGVVIEHSPLVKRYDILILDVANGTPSWTTQQSGSSNDIFINFTVLGDQGSTQWRQVVTGNVDPSQSSLISTIFQGHAGTFNILISSNTITITNLNTNITDSHLIINTTTTDVQLHLPTIIESEIATNNLTTANTTRLM
jgi:hypothetical protein